MNGCNFMEHQGACTHRAERVEFISELVHQALERANALERAERSCDLFAPVGLPGERQFWWGVHRACGIEYRRLERLFWRRCEHYQAALA